MGTHATTNPILEMPLEAREVLSGFLNEYTDNILDTLAEGISVLPEGTSMEKVGKFIRTYALMLDVRKELNVI